MGSPTANKAFTLPTVAGDVLLWGPELNFNWLIPEDGLLGGSITFNASGGNQFLTSSQAYNLLYSITGNSTANISITFPSATAGGGLYVIDNNTTGVGTISVTTNSFLSVPLTIPQNGQSLIVGNGTTFKFANDAFHNNGTIEFVVDGVGGGIQGKLLGYQVAPFSGTITKVTVLANAASTQAIDIQKTTFANFDGGATHPSSGDSITGSSQPNLSGARSYQSTTLSGWNTTVNSGDILAITSTTGSTTITRFTVSLTLTRT